MTEPDETSLRRWLKENPPETIEEQVLQHVQIRSVQKRGRPHWEVRDMEGNYLIHVAMPSRESRRAQKVDVAGLVTAELLKTVMCGACGDKLLPGETVRCTPCEATQTMDLLRMVRDLSDG